MARQRLPLWSMRLLVPLLASLASLAFASIATASGVSHTISGNGVKVSTPASWHSIRPMGDGAVVDPRTVLVVGTKGVAPSPTSVCQIAAYRVPVEGAVVVVVRWRTLTSGGGKPTMGLAPLAALTRVSRPSFECFKGRGAAAQLGLQKHAYQVNLMVGDRATPKTVAQALAVARSFKLAS
jgi:hypothetical protein